MNKIKSVIVDDNFEHGTCAKKCAVICTKNMCK